MSYVFPQCLFELQDPTYRLFQIKLMPGVDPNRVIGVRTPQLRALAKDIVREGQADDFLDSLPHRYYDENNLHGFVLSAERDYDRCIKRLEAFLPEVDNWATCDLLAPRAFKVAANRPRLLLDIRRWMSSQQPYIIRFGIEMLMSHFLDDAFHPDYLDWVADISRRELSASADSPYHHYYVRMMVAWYFATALAKQYDAALPYLEQRQLSPWTHRKSIQKAIESYRISEEQKAYLRGLR